MRLVRSHVVPLPSALRALRRPAHQRKIERGFVSDAAEVAVGFGARPHRVADRALHQVDLLVDHRKRRGTAGVSTPSRSRSPDFIRGFARGHPGPRRTSIPFRVVGGRYVELSAAGAAEGGQCGDQHERDLVHTICYARLLHASTPPTRSPPASVIFWGASTCTPSAQLPTSQNRWCTRRV